MLVCCLGLLPGLRAQSHLLEDVVYLHNGSIIRGQLLENVPGSHVRIGILGGSELVYQYEEIERITQEPSPYRNIKLKLYKDDMPVTYRQKGIYNLFSLGMGFGENEWGGTANVSFQYRLGWHFGQYLNAGLGSGLDPYGAGLFMPVWAEIHGDLMQKVVSPHYVLQLGYGIPVEQSWNILVLEGGPLLHAGVGFKVNTRRRTEWTFTWGFKAQHTYQERREWWGPNGEPVISRGVRRYQRIVFQASIGF
ncbi:MAG: hypothetical protein D6730_14295 [Bacteroidetes bacterium]|nr:MAG: hypothetical protein D6730_14295 [Bacteroidota bacterium]